MSWLSDYFKMAGGSNTNPADDAMPYLNKIPDVSHHTFDPYISHGMNSYEKINPVLSNMANNPAAYIDSLLQNYQPSKAYQLKNEEMRRAAGNTAAAGGMRGSLDDISKEARISDYLLSDDMQQWLNNVFNVQSGGLSGLGHFYDTGYDASGRLGGDLTNALGTKAQLAFQGGRERNQQRSDARSALLKALGAFGGGLTEFMNR